LNAKLEKLEDAYGVTRTERAQQLAYLIDAGHHEHIDELLDHVDWKLVNCSSSMVDGDLLRSTVRSKVLRAFTIGQWADGSPVIIWLKKIIFRAAADLARERRKYLDRNHEIGQATLFIADTTPYISETRRALIEALEDGSFWRLLSWQTGCDPSELRADFATMLSELGVNHA
jgi:hypothetical protein